MGKDSGTLWWLQAVKTYLRSLKQRHTFIIVHVLSLAGTSSFSWTWGSIDGDNIHSNPGILYFQGGSVDNV